MAEAFLDSLLKTKSQPPPPNTECCICLETLTLSSQSTSSIPSAHPNRPIRLPCTHTLHHTCILTWLSTPTRNTCPLCRSILFPLASPQTPQETTLQLARAELQRFYGTNQLLQRGMNGESDIYDEGQYYPERLYTEEWQLDDRSNFFARRLCTNYSSEAPRTGKEARTRRIRDRAEVRTYIEMRRHIEPRMPALASSSVTELGEREVDVYYTMLTRMGVFTSLWPSRSDSGSRSADGPTRRQMFELIRDSGYAYQWRENGEWNGWRRCGWRRPGRERDPSTLSPEARALLVREPVPSLEQLRRERGEGVLPSPGVVGRLGMSPVESHARRVLGWYRRHWSRGIVVD